MTKIRFCCAVLAALLLAACSSSQDLSTVRSAVTQLHELMAKQDFHQIYVDAADELRNNTTEQQFVTLLSAVDRKLGPAKNSQETGWKIDLRTTGSVVTLSQKTTFERGTGTETFVYRIAGAGAVLMGYHIDSSDMLVN